MLGANYFDIDPVPTAAMDPEPIKLPGFGHPINYQAPGMGASSDAVMDWYGQALTVRELKMIELMNQITEKPDWNRKVFDENITQKWRQEALDAENVDVTEKMLDWVRTFVL